MGEQKEKSKDNKLPFLIFFIVIPISFIFIVFYIFTTATLVRQIYYIGKSELPTSIKGPDDILQTTMDKIQFPSSWKQQDKHSSKITNTGKSAWTDTTHSFMRTFDVSKSSYSIGEIGTKVDEIMITNSGFRKELCADYSCGISGSQATPNDLHYIKNFQGGTNKNKKCTMYASVAINPVWTYEESLTNDRFGDPKVVTLNLETTKECYY